MKPYLWNAAPQELTLQFWIEDIEEFVLGSLAASADPLARPSPARKRDREQFGRERSMTGTGQLPNAVVS